MNDKYEAVIGLEVHSELKTRTKIFCSCTTEYGGEENTHVCPVCLGLPGTLPVLNKKALEYAVRAGLALNCQIAGYSKFDRKNYFYPDLNKAYQISQYDLPICKEGYLDITLDGKTKRIGITRIHLEEDAGKLQHGGADITSSQYSLADYNRAGVPLIEIVSEPDMRSAEEAKAYMEKLKAILEYIDVSDVKMEQSSLRFDANVSIRLAGAAGLGTRAEIKNMNSFRALQRAIEYEINRQIEVLEKGGQVIQETRTWDEEKCITISMRTKEEAHDYRYFPEPDLVPVILEQKWVREIRDSLPELPDARKKRLIEVMGLSEYDASIITGSRALAEFFDETAALYRDPKTVANWIMGELLRLLNASSMEIQESLVTPENLAALLELIDEGKVSTKMAKAIFAEMFASGKEPQVIVKDKGMTQISDEDALITVIEEVIRANPQSVADYMDGREKALGFLVGQIMKETKGQANPGLANRLLKEKLGR